MNRGLEKIKRLVRGMFIIPLVLIGCGTVIEWVYESVNREPVVTELREKGALYSWKAYEKLPETPELHVVAKPQKLEIHIIGDLGKIRAMYPHGNPIALSRYFPKENRYELWVPGKETEYGIYIDQESLGHELMHVLNIMSDDRVLNPDDLGNLGL